MRAIRTPLIYYGGKTKLAPFIINEIHQIPHKTFVDVFGGGAAVTIAKAPSEREVYNDIGHVVGFFRVMRDPEKSKELERRLKLTPWSRKEFFESLDWSSEEDEVERVRKWFTLINQGFTHEESCESWLVSKGVNPAQAWANRNDLLSSVAARFRNIIVECLSFEKLIPLWDHKDVLFYCDPPYFDGSRVVKGGGYENEMLPQQHEELLYLLNNIEGQAIVSGYSCPLYDDSLKDWRLKEVTRRSHIHNGSSKDVSTRTEKIWVKEHQNGLWSDFSFSSVEGGG